MASARSESSGGYQSSAPTSGQLDFYEAMADFRTMFPKLDPDVIEAVLRANNGVVESTIDHLLKLNEGNEDFVPYRDIAREIPPDLLPPSYDAATATGAASAATSAQERRCRKAVEAGFGGDVADDLASSQHHHQHQQQPPPPAQAVVDSGAYRNWKPPLLGALPDDFLRLSTGPGSARNARGPGGRCRNCGRHHHHHRHHHRHTSARRHAANAAPAPIVRAATLPAQPSAMSSSVGATGISEMDTVEGLLHRRLMENEMKRRGSAGAAPGLVDADFQQCLDDERMAIMLQNEEFLRMLRRDDDFMRALHSDRVSALATTTSHSTDRPDGWSRGGECFNPQMREYAGSETGRGAVVPAEIGKDENEELRHQLKHMGKFSRKRFGDLAKRFFTMRYKKKQPNVPFYKTDLPTESTMNLLDDDEADEESRHQQQQQQQQLQLQQQQQLNEQRRRERINFEPLPGAMATLPSYRTVQRPMYHPDCISTFHDDSKDMV